MCIDPFYDKGEHNIKYENALFLLEVFVLVVDFISWFIVQVLSQFPQSTLTDRL